MSSCTWDEIWGKIRFKVGKDNWIETKDDSFKYLSRKGPIIKALKRDDGEGFSVRTDDGNLDVYMMKFEWNPSQCRQPDDNFWEKVDWICKNYGQVALCIDTEISTQYKLKTI